MNTILLQQPVWVNSAVSLNNACKALQNESCLAVDTESNSLFAYQEKICLIQISSQKEDFIFDPFVLQDLTPLGKLFSNPAQEKIFHASEYDIICLKRDYGFKFANIFDTMIASRILGYTQIGLGSLLAKHFEIMLNKKYQRANWGLRPLPPEMLDYARQDTHYLFQLRDVLSAELSAQNLLELAKEDFVAACHVKAHHSSNNQSECWKVAGANHIDCKQAAILQELCKYRDEQARKADLPHFKVLSSELLLALSLQKPTTLEELKEIDHCSERIINRHGNGLLQAIVRGVNAQPVYRQKNIKPDDAHLARLERLKAWRKKTAKSELVESDVILPREMMERIAAENPVSEEALAHLMIDSPVRFQKFGALILNTLKSEENS